VAHRGGNVAGPALGLVVQNLRGRDKRRHVARERWTAR
jgi:hypothetical protein